MTHYNQWAKQNNFKEYRKLKDFCKDFDEFTGLTRSKVSTYGYQIVLKN